MSSRSKAAKPQHAMNATTKPYLGAKHTIHSVSVCTPAHPAPPRPRQQAAGPTRHASATPHRRACPAPPRSLMSGRGPFHRPINSNKVLGRHESNREYVNRKLMTQSFNSGTKSPGIDC